MSASRPWAVVFGGPSPEHEISILTGLQAERVLTDGGETVHPIYWAPSGEWFLVPNGTEAKDYLEGAPKSAKPLEVRLAPEPGFYSKKSFGSGSLDIDAALLCFHGGIGEGGGAAAIFDAMGIPATGSTLFAGAVGMDKLAFGGLMEAAGIPTLPRRAVSAATEPGYKGPYIVKPRFGGSSIGIEIADDLASARALAHNSPHLKNGAVLEPYKPNLVDLNIGFRTFPTLELTDLEKPLRGGEDSGLYSYAEKYLAGGAGSEAGLSSAPREFPAKYPAKIHERAAELARAVADVTRLTGVVRLDLLLDEKSGELVVNEVNSIPGALSLYLWAPKHPALTILRDALTEARDRRVVFPQAGHGGGVALRAAGGISAKLLGLG
jgi:D-alanine-D-alanine ligase